MHVECLAQCLAHRAINGNLKKQRVSPIVLSPQASRLIVTFDEHVISNNFKFGVIYQKLGQVCSPPPPCPPHIWPCTWDLRPLPGRAPAEGLSFPGAQRLPEVPFPAFLGVNGARRPSSMTSALCASLDLRGRTLQHQRGEPCLRGVPRIPWPEGQTAGL